MTFSGKDDVRVLLRFDDACVEKILNAGNKHLVIVVDGLGGPVMQCTTISSLLFDRRFHALPTTLVLHDFAMSSSALVAIAHRDVLFAQHGSKLFLHNTTFGKVTGDDTSVIEAWYKRYEDALVHALDLANWPKQLKKLYAKGSNSAYPVFVDPAAIVPEGQVFCL